MTLAAGAGLEGLPKEEKGRSRTTYLCRLPRVLEQLEGFLHAMNSKGLIVHFPVDLSFADEPITEVFIGAIHSRSKYDGNTTSI